MIEVHQLTKTYRGGKGIFDVTFTVQPGEVFGFLGPNGAGKTTTIRHLLGFTNADAGEARIRGLNTRTQSSQIQSQLGYLPGEIAFFDGMNGHEFLNFIAQLRQKDLPDLRAALIERFELESDRPIRKMSKGMKQKVALIAAFMHDPDILILDEPTSGLDPLMQRRFVELIQEQKDAGKTILMSSHQFEEIEKTCQNVAIIREGRIVEVQSIQALKALIQRSYTITFKDASACAAFLRLGFDVRAHTDVKVEVVVADQPNALIRALSQFDVLSLDMLPQSLEEIFIQYYGQQVTS